MRLYPYIGPPEIAARSRAAPRGAPIRSRQEAEAWLAAERPAADVEGLRWVTFVVDAGGVLRLASRHAEHVACAGGGPVRAAGELALGRSRAGQLLLGRATNLSTGYCPEPESWPALAEALARAGLAGPAGYAPAFDFRRCERCSEVAVVKDSWFECAHCGAELPARWNLEPR